MSIKCTNKGQVSDLLGRIKVYIVKGLMPFIIKGVSSSTFGDKMWVDVKN